MAPQGKRLYFQAMAAGGVGFVTFGWDAGVLGGVLLTDSFLGAMNNPSVTTISMITSVFLLGSWLGCILMSIVGLALGRRTWILIGNGIEVIGSIISASSYGPGQLIAGRVLVGLGNGLLTSMIPVYVAEMAIDKTKRGRGVDSLIAMATTGASLAYWVDFGMVFTSGQVVWRFPVAFQIVIAGLSMGLLWPLPDSPRWYYAKDREVDGDFVLEQLYMAPVTDQQVAATKAEILASLELEKANNEGLRIQDFFWDTSATQSARRIKTGMILLALAYLQEIDMLFYYTSTIFQTYIGLAPLTASGLAAALNTVEAICNWISLPFIERMGRRHWLIIGGIFQTIFIAAFTGLLSHPGPKTAAAAAAMLFGFVLVFGPGWGPFAYVYTSEIMPLRYRHVGFSLFISCQWLFAFVTVFAGPIAVTNRGWTAWIWFLVFNAISVPFVYYYCPETCGKSLEEIDLIFISQHIRGSAAAVTLAHADGFKDGIGRRDTEHVNVAMEKQAHME